MPSSLYNALGTMYTQVRCVMHRFMYTMLASSLPLFCKQVTPKFSCYGLLHVYCCTQKQICYSNQIHKLNGLLCVSLGMCCGLKQPIWNMQVNKEWLHWAGFITKVCLTIDFDFPQATCTKTSFIL